MSNFSGDLKINSLGGFVNKKMSKLLVALIVVSALMLPLLFQHTLVKANPDAGDAWSAPENITPILENGYLVERNTLLIDSEYNIHIVYYTKVSDTGYVEIFYATNKTGVWASTQLSNLGAYALQYSPCIGIDSHNVLHIAWTGLISGKAEIFYTNNSGNTWHTPLNITNTASIDEQFFTFIIDSADNIHGVYLTYDNVYYVNRTYNGVWSTPQPLFTAPYTVATTMEAGLAFTTGDNPYIIVKALNSSDNNIYGFNGITSPPVLISSNKIGDSDSIALTSDRNGHVHLLYPSPDGSVYNLLYQFYNGSAWSNIEVILNGTVEDTGLIYSPAISCDYDSKPHIAFIAEKDTYQLLYLNKTMGSWGTPVVVVDNADTFYSNMQIGRNGFAHIIFSFYLEWSETRIAYTHTLEPVGSAWPAPTPSSADLTMIIIIVVSTSVVVVIAGITVYMVKKR